MIRCFEPVTNLRRQGKPSGAFLRCTVLLTLAASLLGLMFGCHSFNLTLLSRDKTGGKTDGDGPALAAGLPSKNSLRIAPIIFFSDLELKKDHPIFQDIARLSDQVYRELQLPPGNAVVQVYLFEDKERYDRYMQAAWPTLPNRRAFFVAKPRTIGGQPDLLVYTVWGDRIQQDLRHELTHALLHSVLKFVPIWLDEGLAEYFELPPANNGLNPKHVNQLRRDLAGGLKFDLDRLENLSQVEQMGHAEYRESWAWVHLMLRGNPDARTTLLTYLHQLRDSEHPTPLSPQLKTLLGSPEEALCRHVGRLDPDSVPAMPQVGPIDHRAAGTGWHKVNAWGP
jgi:hypothetical protein